MKRTALITGASEGIGLELARIHARAGDRLVLVARRKEQLEALKKELEENENSEVILLVMDLSLPESAHKIYDALNRDGIQVDYLINNAGFGHYGWFPETPWEKESNMIQLNITTLTLLTKLFISGMMQRGYGRVMNVASTAAFVPGPWMAVYYSTKAYVLSFSVAVANELKGTGVTVTALCPGPTRSGFQTAAEIANSKLFSSKKIPSAKQVAAFGYRSMMKGKVVAIHGLMNRMIAAVSGIIPRKAIAGMVRRMQKED